MKAGWADHVAPPEPEARVAKRRGTFRLPGGQVVMRRKSVRGTAASLAKLRLTQILDEILPIEDE